MCDPGMSLELEKQTHTHTHKDIVIAKKARKDIFGFLENVNVACV